VTTTAIVLAAGKGTRMKSDLPKVLHSIAGKPLVTHALASAREAGVDRFVVVVGHGAEQVKRVVSEQLGDTAEFAVQAEQNGTGHAVLCALPALGDLDGPVLILSGDVPGTKAETLRVLIEACEGSTSGLAFATFRAEDPTGYGRVVRNDAGHPVRIVEHKDASPDELKIDECNAGIYCVRAEHLRGVLPSLGTSNAQGEIYLTDLVEHVAETGEVVGLVVDAVEVAGVNTKAQLAELERVLAERG
jgi:bifunctional UDP-N-acetylglucosamine pyrophosphorylase/glucosamine-1-phosphate N-acetyltransferase